MKRRNLLFLVILLLLAFAFINIIGQNTTSAAFTKSGNTNVSVNCASFSDLFIVEFYDGSTLISQDDISFDKEYTVKIYNKSTLTCNFYLTTEGTEINTFSSYVITNVSQDLNYNLNLAKASSIANGQRLSSLMNIISVTNFKPSEEPMIFTFKISTDSLKIVAQNAPDRITDFDFDLKLSFIAKTVAE